MRPRGLRATPAQKRRAPETSIRRNTRSYEAWLRRQVTVSEAELRRKHRAMRVSLFAFLRATYYHWAKVWPIECAELLKAPVVLSVGDLHVENFGTWRDSEGRLAWGVNDFDEAAPLPYTNDLVRLATSAAIAARDGRLSLTRREIWRALLEGYTAAIDAGGLPVILAERHRKLGDRVVRYLVDPRRFWSEKLGRNLRRRPRVPKGCEGLLRRSLPRDARPIESRARVAGLGSLGRPRFVTIAEWGGARIAREAKALVPSATLWARGERPPKPKGAYVERLLSGAVRCRDPHLRVTPAWIVRRLAPDSDKIRLESMGARALELELLVLMGAEAANVHLATNRMRAAIRRDLHRRRAGWLGKAARRMLARMLADHLSLRRP